jgi:hypothetical protein
MAQFPKTDPEILALAQAMLRGFHAHPDLFPNPPVNLDHFGGKLAEHGTLDHDWHAIQAQAQALTVRRNESLDRIAKDMRVLLRYAEITVSDETQLGIIGWSGRAAPTRLQIPGQCRMLVDAKRGTDWITLNWQAPAEGGKPASYVIECREMPDGRWTVAGTTLDTQLTLTGQPRGKTLEYRVYAKNRAGDGVASNVVEVVL